MMNDSNNPFHFDSPLSHDSIVYLKRGRDVEDKALQHLERMDWFSINEPRQCGKTSLISWLANHKQLLSADYSFANVNMSRLANISNVTEEKWYRALHRSLLTEITGHSGYAQVLPPRNHQTRATLGAHSVYLFDSEDKWPAAPTDSDSWWQFLSDLAGCAVEAEQRLVIVFDNVTRSNLRRTWISGCFRTLRNIFDSRQLDPNLYRLAFVFVGTYAVNSLISPSPDSPLLEPLRIRLPDFSKELVKKLVEHLNLSIEETMHITDRIYYWVAGHPYLTQLLCYRLAELHKSPTVEDVDHIVTYLCNLLDLGHFSPLLEAAQKESDLRPWIERLLQGDEFRFSAGHRARLRLELLGLIKTGYGFKCEIRNRLYKKLLEVALGAEDTRSPVATKTPLTIFYCYAHEDKALRTELAKHLSPLQRRGYIINWYDGEVLAGTVREDKIMTQLNAAHIILLLISPDFVASDYCYSKEMRRAIERHDAKEARVIPIILRPVIWSELPFAHLQVLPSGGKPVCSSQWANKDEAFHDVVQGILAVVENFFPPGYSQSP